jgi:hypothetical protein
VGLGVGVDRGVAVGRGVGSGLGEGGCAVGDGAEADWLTRAIGEGVGVSPQATSTAASSIRGRTMNLRAPEPDIGHLLGRRDGSDVRGVMTAPRN